MARIAATELPDNLRLVYALTRIKGIGWTSSEKILEMLGIDVSKRVSELTSDEIAQITAKVTDLPVEGDLLRSVKSNVTRLQKIGSYRGIRHSRGLPVRGQRTRHNARTKRGKRKTVGAFKKEMLAKVDKPKEKTAD